MSRDYEPNETFRSMTVMVRSCIDSALDLGMSHREIIEATLDCTLVDRMLAKSEQQGTLPILGGWGDA